MIVALETYGSRPWLLLGESRVAERSSDDPSDPITSACAEMAFSGGLHSRIRCRFIPCMVRGGLGGREKTRNVLGLRDRGLNDEIGGSIEHDGKAEDSGKRCALV